MLREAYESRETFRISLIACTSEIVDFFTKMNYCGSLFHFISTNQLGIFSEGRIYSNLTPVRTIENFSSTARSVTSLNRGSTVIVSTGTTIENTEIILNMRTPILPPQQGLEISIRPIQGYTWLIISQF